MHDTAPAVVAEVTVKVVEPPSLETRRSWIEDTLTATASARSLMLKDEQYYYGKQWSPEDLAKLKKRKQPPLVKNLIRRKVNSIRGEEIEKRVDPVARPRTPKHEDEARAITDMLRFVEEDQRIDELGGDLMLDLAVAGQCGAIIETDSDDGYRCTVTHIPWNQIVIDARSRRRDAADAVFIANLQWLELDDAIEIYQGAEDVLRRGVSQHQDYGDNATEDRPRAWFDGKRKRVRVCEMYYRQGKIWYRCDFAGDAELRECAPSPYLDPRTGRPWCPIVVRRCYLDDDNAPHGVVRDMISPQDEVNKRSSKFLHIVNTKQVIYEDGALPDVHAFQEQIAQPDGAAKVSPGALSDGQGRLQINTGADMGAAQFQLMQTARNDIDSIGPASSMLPELPQSASGRAFMARQKSATRELGPLFDVFGDMRLDIYWHVWGCARQFLTDELWLRVTDEEETAGYRFVGLNRRMTRAERLQELLEKGQPLPVALGNAAGDAARGVIQRVQQMHVAMAQQAIQLGMPPPGGDEHMLQMIAQDPVMQEMIINNNVGEAMVDITIHEAPESAILEDEEFAKLTDLAGVVLQQPANQHLAPFLIRMIVRMSAFRDKREILKEMDKPPDPAQQQAQQQQQQLAQQMQQLQMAGAQANVGVMQTQAQLNAAKAQAEQAKVQISGAKVPSEIERNKAMSLHNAALAGSKTGGG